MARENAEKSTKEYRLRGKGRGNKHLLPKAAVKANKKLFSHRHYQLSPTPLRACNRLPHPDRLRVTLRIARHTQHGPAFPKTLSVHLPYAATRQSGADRFMMGKNPLIINLYHNCTFSGVAGFIKTNIAGDAIIIFNKSQLILNHNPIMKKIAG